MAVSLNFHPIITPHAHKISVITILTEELPIAFTFSQARVAHGTPITNDAPYVSCHEVKSTHLHGRTPRRGALPTDLRIQV